MTFRVLRSGIMTSVQDGGRWGFQSLGVPVSGPMDWYSHRLANRLVGNADAAASLEVTLIGPELEFDDEAVVAIAGADFAVDSTEGEMASGVAHTVAAGSRLRFGSRRRGARAYLAIRGGIAVPPVLGSCATHLVSRMGGFEGRALRAGDRVPAGPAGTGPAAHHRAGPGSGEPLPLPDGGARLRVIPGPQLDRFVPEALEVLRSSRYRITTESDRMGYRLEGPTLRVESPDIISDATPPGALQVPGSGQPILLMADRQTTGGYPKIAFVITADLPVAGQLAPGDWVAFDVCDRPAAIVALRARETSLGASA